MTKEKLILNIKNAFTNVQLEEGIGIWEGQGVDDYADAKTMAELRNKDERNNWENITYKDLVTCQSSLHFFDAKGMRFCLPPFLIFSLLSNEIYKQQGIHAPDLIFTLSNQLNEEYQLNRFSLFNKAQIQSVIHYLVLNLAEVVEYHKSQLQDANPNSLSLNENFIILNKAINEWKQKLDE